MTASLRVGMMCTKKLHRIESMDDITEIHRNTGKIERQCRACRLAGQNQRRARTDLTLLGRGRCLHGHKINGPDDVYVSRYRMGKPILGCKTCRDDPDALLRVPSIDKPRPLALACGCQTYFRPPLPNVGDFILCSLHNTGTEVLRWV